VGRQGHGGGRGDREGAFAGNNKTRKGGKGETTGEPASARLFAQESQILVRRTRQRTKGFSKSQPFIDSRAIPSPRFSGI